MISIILPNFNHVNFLKKRIDSILNQTYQDFELIILDDLSTDGSTNLLGCYKSHPKVSKFEINTLNSGSPFKQWKKGFSLINGDYVWIAESDDYCDLNFLESQLNFLKQNNLDVVIAKTVAVNASNKILNLVQHPIFRHRDISNLDLDVFLYCPILNVSTALFKAELINNTELFSSYKIIGDRVFYYEAFGDKKIGLNKNTTSYFRKETNGVSALNSKDFGYFKKYYSEHRRFAKTTFNKGEISRKLYCDYLKRFFNRINNRMNRQQKLNFQYILLRLCHKFEVNI